MSVQSEITALEERLRVAELGPDPKVFEELLDDNMIVLNDAGDPFLAKPTVISAHQPGRGPKFLDVQITELHIVDHGSAATVTCRGTYKTDEETFTLKFMRIWLKKSDGWKIIAGTVSQPK
jgi:hypothetical protein